MKMAKAIIAVAAIAGVSALCVIILRAETAILNKLNSATRVDQFQYE